VPPPSPPVGGVPLPLHVQVTGACGSVAVLAVHWPPTQYVLQVSMSG
jgi:hypothetical protein